MLIHKSTLRFKFLLTLKNVHKLIPELTIPELKRKLDSFFPRGIYWIVKTRTPTIEFDYLVLIFCRGVSKHTYFSKVSKLFPLFKGEDFNIEGIKSVRKTVEFIVDSMRFLCLYIYLDHNQKPYHMVYYSGDLFQLLSKFHIFVFKTLQTMHKYEYW